MWASNNATVPAAHLNATAYNLTVDVYGDIFGAAGRGGGSGGGAPAISGQKGGDALQMTSTNGANNIVLVRSTGRIYAGGGGGEKELRVLMGQTEIVMIILEIMVDAVVQDVLVDGQMVVALKILIIIVAEDKYVDAGEIVGGNLKEILLEIIAIKIIKFSEDLVE